MSKWIPIRAALVAATCVTSALTATPLEQTEDMPVPFLFAAFVSGIVCILCVVGFQRTNPSSAKNWRYPAWSINPFLMREPLQFCHFGGYFMIASGLGIVISRLFSGPALSVSDCVPVAAGLGILCGVRACTIVYHDKMVSGDSTAPGSPR